MSSVSSWPTRRLETREVNLATLAVPAPAERRREGGIIEDNEPERVTNSIASEVPIGSLAPQLLLQRRSDRPASEILTIAEVAGLSHEFPFHVRRSGQTLRSDQTSVS